MNIFNKMYTTVSGTVEKFASLLNKSKIKEVYKFVSDYMAMKKDNDEKLNKSLEAIEQFKQEELEKINAKRKEIELRYSGDIIDLREDEEFQAKLASVKKKNDDYKVQMMENLAELESDIFVLTSKNDVWGN